MDKEYTRTEIYEVRYACYDTERKIVVDSYPVGYFVSKEEALDCLKNEVFEGRDLNLTEYAMEASFMDDRPDVPWQHCYQISKIFVGLTVPYNSITAPVSLD